MRIGVYLKITSNKLLICVQIGVLMEPLNTIKIMFNEIMSHIPGTPYSHDSLEADLPREIPRQHPVELVDLPLARGAEQRDVVHRTCTELAHATYTTHKLMTLYYRDHFNLLFFF